MTTALLAFQRLFRSNASQLRFFSTIPHLEHYIDSSDGELPEDFLFFPEFLNEDEQRVLLASALHQLDDNDSSRAKRNLKHKFKDKDIYHLNNPTVEMFLPEESGCYGFEEGHYDGVIRHFREKEVTSWPPNPILEPVLRRLHTLLPARLPYSAILTHILHLSSNGQILPHVDNVEASGSWIAAVSLGSPRILKMEGPKTFEVLLPSGSAYVQKETVRYSYKHSILTATTFKNHHITPGQRLSVMLRDRLTPGLT